MVQSSDTQNAYSDVYEQYVDVASFVWLLRSLALNRPHYTMQDIQVLERRLEAQLDGIMTSIGDGWRACENAVEMGEPGEIFTAAVIAIRSHDINHIRLAVEKGLANETAINGLISAMGWLPDYLANPWIEKFLNGKDLDHKFLGIAACSVRRQNPGDLLAVLLKRSDCLQNVRLHARALRLIGELRRHDLMPAITAGASSDNVVLKFWSTWSAVLLGSKHAIDHLKPYIFMDGPYHNRAIQLAFRALPMEQARSWIAEMAKNNVPGRSIILATGILGDPHAINWLITKMQEPKYARIAGEAFSKITGADLEQLQATKPPPEARVGDPNDDANDTNIALDDDEYLPWPEPSKVAMLWQRHGQHFIVGRRYFCGRPLALEVLKDRLNNGFQRQRHAAALELALMDPDHRFVNTKTRTIS